MIKFNKSVSDPDRCIIKLDDNTILIADVPDWVTLPEELGGGRANIISASYLDFKGEKLLHYELDVKHNGKTLWVAKGDKFYWHTR